MPRLKKDPAERARRITVSLLPDVIAALDREARKAYRRNRSAAMDAVLRSYFGMKPFVPKPRGRPAAPQKAPAYYIAPKRTEAPKKKASRKP